MTESNLIQATRRAQRNQALRRNGTSQYDALDQGWMIISAQFLVSIGRRSVGRIASESCMATGTKSAPIADSSLAPTICMVPELG